MFGGDNGVGVSFGLVIGLEYFGDEFDEVDHGLLIVLWWCRE